MCARLSELLNLRLNGYPIRMHQKVDAAALKAHRIKKVGMLGRLLLKHAQNEVIYWSKACTLKYIDEAEIHAIKPTGKKHSPPAQSYNTSAFFHCFDGTLTAFAFQIMNNPVMAETIMKAVEQKIIACIGKTEKSNGGVKTWRIGNEKLVFAYPEAGSNGCIHLFGNS